MHRSIVTTRHAVGLLRAAAIVFAFYCFGHTWGGMLHAETGGLGQAAVFAAMRRHHFAVQGATRTYWDYYRGFGFFTSVTLALMAALCWMLARLARAQPEAARPLVIVLAVASVPMTILAWTNFFAAPALFGTVTTILLVVASVALRRGGVGEAVTGGS